MVKFLIHRPVAVIVSFVALLLLGGIASHLLPTALLPDTDIPQINLRVEAAELSARDIEHRLAEPLRSELQQMHGLEQIVSRSGEGSADIHLTFEHGTDMSMAFIATNEKVDLVMADLPREIERPQVTRMSISDIPVFHLNLYDSRNKSERRLAELSSFTREVIKRRLEQLPEIAMVDISGLSRPQVELRPRKGFLRAIGIDHNRLLEAFEENRINLGNIMVRDGHYRYFLHFNSSLLDLGTIENIPININGRIFLLKELADIQLESAPASGSFFINEHRAIDVAIIKQSAARMEDLQQGFYELVRRFDNDYPQLTFSVTQDQTALLDYSVGNLKQDLLVGGILAFICMLVFIRQFKPAILIGITIPVSILLSQLGFYLFDLSINIISLGGLILGLGMIIDNSIVVIDTIALHRKQTTTNADAAINGTNEIIAPLLSSIITNCVVFIPLIFMSGLAGAIFYDQALSVIIGVIASMLVAIFLLPPLFVLIDRIKPLKKPMPEISSYVNVTGWYETGMRWVFSHRLLTSLITGFFFLVGAFCLIHLKKERLPPISRHEMEVTIDWNQDVSLEESHKRIALFLEQHKDKWQNYSCWLGPQQYLLSDLRNLGPNEAKLYINTVEPHKMKALQSLFEQEFMDKYNNILLQSSPASNAFDAVFADKNAPLTIAIQEQNKQEIPPIDILIAFTDSLRKALPSSCLISAIPLHPRLILSTDVEKAALYNVSLSTINTAVMNAIGPQFVDHFEGAESLIPIVIPPTIYPSLQEMFQNTYVRNRNDREYPLTAFVSSRIENDFRFITAGKQGTFHQIDIHTEQPEATLQIVKKIQRNFSEKLKFDYSGSYFENRRLVVQMTIILLVSVLLLYFILAVQFESLIQPLFILIELPVAIMGAIVFLYLGSNSINLMSMIGIIIMGGLVINDSILKIDAINRLRRTGVPLMEAIHEGGLRRLKPIVMISLTSIGALLPTLFMSDLGSELQKPLSLALFGGMTVGLLVSLFFVPLIYWMVYRKSEKKNVLSKP